uniref:helicase with zinc finger domain 2-like n=1 Tax=Callithrix jacchus TaxID=9483 RepID=UPI0023DD2A82|nr:helicase with zinc finger domain 2-like [Callithrix jacchus]
MSPSELRGPLSSGASDATWGAKLLFKVAPPGSSLLPNSPAATRGPSLARLCALVDLRLGCYRCSKQLNESTCVLRGVEHDCPGEILLACLKQAPKSKVWCRVGCQPAFPRPLCYKVCRYYSPGLGCQRHWNRCTFACSCEEALVWTFEREQGLERVWLKAEVLPTTRLSRGLPGAVP